MNTNYKQLSIEQPNTLIFDPLRHEYWLNGRKLITTTELLAKHGLSVDYGDVAPKLLEEAAEFGNFQHEQLENYFKGYQTYDEVNDITKLGIELLQHNGIDGSLSEIRVHNGRIAGTVDLVGMKDNKFVLIDFKFTSQLYTNAVMWQTNVYRRLLWENHQIHAEELYVLWFDKKEGDFKLREIPILDDDNITKLFDLEEKGQSYKKEQSLVLFNVGNQLALNEKLNQLAEAEDYVKSLKNELDIVKEELMVQMDKYGVSSFDLDDHRITYIAPTKTTKIDYKKLIEDNGLDTKEYQNVSDRKGYVRISEIGKKSKAEVVRDIKDRNYSKRFKTNLRIEAVVNEK